MKIKRLYFVLIIISIFLSGCEQPPLAEMESAREAVFRAENDENAVLYAAETLARARSAIDLMQQEADSKRYEAAKTHAAEAVAAAEKAIADGRAGSQRAGVGSISLISGLRQEIEETSKNVSSARYALMDLDYDALDRRIINAHNEADRAEFDQAAGKYQDAIDRAAAIRADLANINQMVANAAVIRKK
ncbi:MAG: DUF4398 domain-containing protein [Treponema sp.]|nr:DUF4398 domain-containing protein [Treponema sp.]